MKAFIYRFKYKDRSFYGQGLNERYIKSALETKLGLPQGALSEGSTRLSMSELEKITSNKRRWINLVKWLRFKEPLAEDIRKLSIKDIEQLTDRRNISVRSVLSRFLNIPWEIMLDLPAENFNKDDPNDITVTDLLTLSNDKILVKTHKVDRETEHGEGIAYFSSNPDNEVLISRVDEMKDLIRKLIKRDPYVFRDVHDKYEELDRLQSTYSKSAEAVKSYNISRSEQEKHERRLIELPPKIQEVKDQISIYHTNVYWNTGYHVNFKDQYEFNTYDEFLEALESMYNKIKYKLEAYHFQNIPWKDGHDFTMGEYLDSFELSLSQNNYYITEDKTSEDET